MLRYGLVTKMLRNNAVNHVKRFNVYLCAQHKDNYTVSRGHVRSNKHVCIFGGSL